MTALAQIENLASTMNGQKDLELLYSLHKLVGSTQHLPAVGGPQTGLIDPFDQVNVL